jgi:hypothetical protein
LDDDIGVLDISPAGPEWVALREKIVSAHVAELHSSGTTDFDRDRDEARFGADSRGDFNARVGITLVFKWHEWLIIPASEREGSSDSGSLRWLGFTGGSDPFDMKAEKTRRGWTIGMRYGDKPDRRNVEDLRALGLTEDRDFILRLGAAGQQQDVVLDGKGAGVRVGDRSISLSRERKTTIVIGGNPRKKEPLRVLRTETVRSSSAKGGAKA